MRTRIQVRFAAAAGVALLLLPGGCAVPPPASRVERDWGVSHRLAVYGQTADPKAEQNLAPVAGIDGKAALGVMTGYRDGFGYDSSLDANAFDVRPLQPGVSEVRIKDLSGGKGGAAGTSVVIPAK